MILPCEISIDHLRPDRLTINTRMKNMREIIDIVATPTILTEDVTKREWTFYHGTKSDPFIGILRK